MKLITNIQGLKFNFTDADKPIRLGYIAQKGNPVYAEYFQVVDNGTLGGSVASFTIMAFLESKEMYTKQVSVRVGAKYFFTDIEKTLMAAPSANHYITLFTEPGVSIYFNKVIIK